MAYEPMYEKITEKELNQKLRSQVADAYDHIFKILNHVSEEDRNRWDSGSSIKIATIENSGLMDSEMVKKLNSIDENANNYTHPETEQPIGTYLLTTIDKCGHVVKGENPELLDITVTKANKLGNYGEESFAKIISPNFIGRPMAPTVENSIVGDNIATTKYVNNILNMALEGTAYIHPESGLTTSGMPDGFVFKSEVETYDDIATAYPSPKYGWVVQVKNTGSYYYYNNGWKETTSQGLKDMWNKEYASVTVDRYGHVIGGQILETILKKIFHIGFIWSSTDPTNPGEIVGGTWEPIAGGRVLVGANDKYIAGKTGGEETHKLTVAETPAHTHTRGNMNITGSFSGVGQGYDKMELHLMALFIE